VLKTKGAGCAEEAKRPRKRNHPRYAGYKPYTGYADEELFMGAVETNDYPNDIISYYYILSMVFSFLMSDGWVGGYAKIVG
jgi:hypothetical protein